jgi:hypothetical protein
MGIKTCREVIVMLDRPRNFVTTRPHAIHVPRTMFAAAIDRFGGPEVITSVCNTAICPKRIQT